MNDLLQRTIRMTAIRADLEHYLDREPTPDEIRRGYREYEKAMLSSAPTDPEEWMRAAIGEPS